MRYAGAVGAGYACDGRSDHAAARGVAGDAAFPLLFAGQTVCAIAQARCGGARCARARARCLCGAPVCAPLVLGLCVAHVCIIVLVVGLDSACMHASMNGSSTSLAYALRRCFHSPCRHVSPPSGFRCVCACLAALRGAEEPCMPPPRRCRRRRLRHRVAGSPTSARDVPGCAREPVRLRGGVPHRARRRHRAGRPRDADAGAGTSAGGEGRRFPLLFAAVVGIALDLCGGGPCG